MLEQVILSLCVNMQTPELSKYYESCKQILTAASIQTHIKPDLEKYQSTVEQIVMQQTGERIWWATGVAYTMYFKNKIILNFSAKPIIDNVNLEFNNDTQNVALTWSF